MKGNHELRKSLPSLDEYSSKELSNQTWPDFEKLFLKQGLIGDGWWCWCIYHHRPLSSHEIKQPLIRAEKAVRNRREKRELVENGCAHGILVYSGKEPVGWCQYGPGKELPHVDRSPRYRRIRADDDANQMWRITCFVVDKNYRGSGVAGVSLKAAL